MASRKLPALGFPPRVSGFTLVELLVVIMIFVVITGMLLANFRRSSHLVAVRNAAEILASNVQRMQAAALSGDTRVADALAFGVHVDPMVRDRYILFADRSNGMQPANGTYDVGEELDAGVITLPRNIRIRTVDPDTSVDMLFGVPRATPRFSTTGTVVRVTLDDAGDGAARAVVVNRISGQVSVE